MSIDILPTLTVLFRILSSIFDVIHSLESLYHQIILFKFRNVNSVKDLSSSSKDYDALVVVATELDQIKDHVDHSVTKDLQAFRQVRF